LEPGDFCEGPIWLVKAEQVRRNEASGEEGLLITIDVK
jgi:hypothetical protein